MREASSRARTQFALLAKRNAVSVNVGRVTDDADRATALVLALQSYALDQDQQLGVVIEAVRKLKTRATDAKSRATSAETCIPEMGTRPVELRGMTEDLTQTGAEARAHVPGFVDADMSRFLTVMFWALLARCELPRLLTLSMMRFPSPPQVLLLRPRLVNLRWVCLSLGLNVLVDYAVDVTV